MINRNFAQENTIEAVRTTKAVAAFKAQSNPEFKPISLVVKDQSKVNLSIAGFDVFRLSQANNSQGRIEKSVKIEQNFLQFVPDTDMGTDVQVIPSTENNFKVLTSHDNEDCLWIIDDADVREEIARRKKELKKEIEITEFKKDTRAYDDAKVLATIKKEAKDYIFGLPKNKAVVDDILSKKRQYWLLEPYKKVLKPQIEARIKELTDALDEQHTHTVEAAST